MEEMWILRSDTENKRTAATTNGSQLFFADFQLTK